MDSKDEKVLQYNFYSLSESHIYYIAVLLIVMTGVLLILNIRFESELSSLMVSSLITWVGTIVGFYFGSKPVSDVVSRLQEKTEEHQRKMKIAEETVDEAYKMYSIAKEIERAYFKEKKEKSKP